MNNVVISLLCRLRSKFPLKTALTSRYNYSSVTMQKPDTTARLIQLRKEMLERKLDAYIVPMEDAHFSEYIAECDKRIAFISGFTGSAGTAVIAVDKAALWTDGRYHNQASQQLDQNWTLMREGLPGVATKSAWLSDVTPQNGRIGFDPQQIPAFLVESFSKSLRKHKSSSHPLSSDHRSLVQVSSENLVDLAWQTLGDPPRPQRPCNPITSVQLSFSGKSWETKFDEVRMKMNETKVDSLVLFALDEIAWLLNLRGSDIDKNPVFFAYLVLMHTEAHLFVETEQRLSSIDLAEHLKSASHAVTFHAYSDFTKWLAEWQAKDTSTVWIPPTASYALTASIADPDRRFTQISPVASMKAVKTDTELAGMREANLVDSLTLCDFIAWLEDVAQTATGPQGILQPSTCTPCSGIDPPKEATEATIADYLDRLRKSTVGCLGLSFSTIAGADSNGAVIHYHVSDGDKCLPVTGNSMFLVDSGGQYVTGTTDVTRTMHLGTPSMKQVEDYTYVLKAHTNLATLIFPEYTKGTKLDVVCRSAMWRSRRDFQHGTGHGVGAHLCVHEGPIGLSGRRSAVLSLMGIPEPGITKDMVVTIEPGYYLDGEYGIRLENVNVVIEARDGRCEPSPAFLGFESITLVPFQRKLISRDLLSPSEVEWIDGYHSRVRDKLLARINREAQTGDGGKLSVARQRTYNWIMHETKPLK